MPSHQERREPLPEWYQFGDGAKNPRCTALIDRYLDENIKSGRFPFTPQGVADCIDDAIGRGVYEHMTANVIEGEHFAADNQNAADRIARYQRDFETGRDPGDES